MPDSNAVLSASIKLPFSGKTVSNRFLKSAMTERLCTFSDDDLDHRGKPTPGYIEAYKQWAQGQLGIIVLGNIPCHREHLEAPGNAVIDRDTKWDPVAAFKPVIETSKANGSLCIGQITHAGRQCPNIVNKHPVSASDSYAFEAMGQKFEASRAMTLDEIRDVIQRYAFAAETLYKAGADGVQLHAAHGYLLSQFLSAKINRRTDKYGGSFENRCRLIFDVLDAIDEKVPKTFVRAIKINSQDFNEDGGWSVEECASIVQKLEAAGVDIIELSGGTYENLAFEHKRESTKKREGFFLEFAERLRPNVKQSILCVTGGFRTRDKCAQAIHEGTCDMIGLARPLCQDPQMPAHLFSGTLDGVTENYVDNSMQTPAAIQQIHAIAEKRSIPNLADRKVAQDISNIIKSGSFPEPKGDYPAC